MKLLDTKTDADPQMEHAHAPACFEIFQKISLECLGSVDIDGLRCLWREEGQYEDSFWDILRTTDFEVVSERVHECIPGTEYLVAHPLRIPGLDDMIEGCVLQEKDRNDVVFSASDAGRGDHDPFATLSAELKLIITVQLSREDVANLRLASRSFQQLSQQYFHHVVTSEMPWVWEIESLYGKSVDWYKLWCKLCAADCGAEHDTVERRWMRHAARSRSRLHTSPAGLIDEDHEEYGLHVPTSGQYELSESQRSMVRCGAKARRIDETQWPRPGELKGLRNRRRIHMDIKEIVRRMQGCST